MARRTNDYATLLETTRDRLQDGTPPLLVGIAGPPATGKSTLAGRLASDLNAADLNACVCPMDGFHMTNAQLDAAGLREAKGSIDTFDGTAFARAVRRLKDGASFWWPQYSRERHDPIPKGTRITGEEAVCIIEGNYVLADVEPWRSAADSFDLRIIMDASDSVLRERLFARHIQSGRSAGEATTKIDRTDIPNAREIRAGYSRADILFTEDACA